MQKSIKKNKSFHSPRLNTIMMIEETIKTSDDYLLKSELWRALPKKVMYQTLNTVLNYLEKSNKIIYDHDNRIIWVSPDNPQIKKLLSDSIRVR